ncbi:hypothetical protein LJY25_03900 [Hymenobacter sp. BT175]|uniref:hypothetical protein n=1 Tax=Hymenobacter translucens TaxID=2886507 RepID=UPI001D0ED353|nr:hypothetical protein [Hymenobacter translucens]MCC2545576.1 hypothetical protein [Hymenobacter translucens]
MNRNLYLFAFLLTLTMFAAQAKPKRERPFSNREVAAPHAADSLLVRSREYASFLQHALDLTPRQARLVQQTLEAELISADSTTAPAPGTIWVATRCHHDLLPILTPGQYSTFLWLESQLPKLPNPRLTNQR